MMKSIFNFYFSTFLICVFFWNNTVVMKEYKILPWLLQKSKFEKFFEDAETVNR